MNFHTYVLLFLELYERIEMQGNVHVMPLFKYAFSKKSMQWKPDFSLGRKFGTRDVHRNRAIVSFRENGYYESHTLFTVVHGSTRAFHTSSQTRVKFCVRDSHGILLTASEFYGNMLWDDQDFLLVAHYILFIHVPWKCMSRSKYRTPW